ncbi:MAG TPA: hypothetical protein VJS20_11585 [Gemmatimonadales bacterium]|nr:hypothetical protein [Gemmatimonadales bacterium]
MANLKLVSVVPQSAPLDSAATVAGVVAGPGIVSSGTVAGLTPDGAALNGRSTGEAALIQTFNAFLMQETNTALTAAGSAQATNTTGVKSANTTTFVIDGVFKSKGATDPLWTLTGSAVTAGVGGATMHYLLCLNASGTASVIQGPTNQGSTTVWTPAPANQMPQDIAACATLKISLTATTVFTPGTTALNAAGVTATFEDGCDATLWGAYQIVGNLI